MGLFVLSVLFLCSMIYPKSKFLCGCILFYIWILYGFNTYSGDYNNYLNVYTNLKTLLFHYEPGYSLLMWFSSSIGLPFTGFRILLSTIYVFLLQNILKRYSSNPAATAVLLTLFPSLHWISLLRNGIAGMIVLYALRYLEKRDTRNTIRFLLCILIAGSFHYSAFFFLILISSRRKVIKKEMYISFIVISFFVYLLFHSDKIYDLARHFSNNIKVLSWLSSRLTSHPNMNGIIAELIAIGLIYGVQKYSYCEAQKAHLYRKNIGPQEMSYFEMTDYVYRLSVFFIPLLFFSSVYMRFFYVIYPLVIISCTNLIPSGKRAKGTLMLSINTNWLMAIGLTLLISYYVDLPYIGTVNDGIRIFKNNLIFR